MGKKHLYKKSTLNFISVVNLIYMINLTWILLLIEPQRVNITIPHI